MPQKVNESLDYQSAARILNLPAPAAGTEPVRLTDLNAAVATLNAAIAGLNYIEQPARVGATVNINTASPGATIDGVTLANGDRILLTAQTNTHENGLWTFNGSAVALTRTADTFEAGTVVTIGPDGTNNKSTLWLQTTDSPVVGTTALTFLQFGTTVSAGTGLSVAGTVISLVSPVVVANGGTNSTTAAGARTNLGAVGTFEQDFGDGSSTSFTITHNLGKQYVHVMIINKSTGAREDCSVVCNSTTQCTLSAEAWTATPPTAAEYRVVVHA